MDKRIIYRAPAMNIHLLIELEEDTITGINFCEAQTPDKPKTDVEKELFNQLDQYFAGELKEFNLPYFATGTVFQLMVWEELLKIPYGETISYGELAERIGKPDAARAVGNALNRNPVPVLLPCHRVIGAKGNLTGFAGGTTLQQLLLDLERENS